MVEVRRQENEMITVTTMMVENLDKICVQLLADGNRETLTLLVDQEEENKRGKRPRQVVPAAKQVYMANRVL